MGLKQQIKRLLDYALLPKLVRAMRANASNRHLLYASYLILVGVIVNFQACSTAETFDKKIKKVNLKQEYKLDEIDIRFANHNLCVLSPYQNKVSFKFLDSDLINKRLEEVKFELSESATLIFYDSNFQLRIERLNELYLRTLDNTTPTTEEIHECGAVKDFYIYKFTSSTMAIFRR